MTLGFDLIIGLADCSVLIRRVLEFDHHQRQAVDKEEHIGPFVLITLDNGKLIYGVEDIIRRVLKINEPDPLAPFLAVLPHRDRNAFGTVTGTPSASIF